MSTTELNKTRMPDFEIGDKPCDGIYVCGTTTGSEGLSNVSIKVTPEVLREIVKSRSGIISDAEYIKGLRSLLAKRQARVEKLESIIASIATEFDGVSSYGDDSHKQQESLAEIETILQQYATEEREQAEFDAVDDRAENPPEL